MDNTNQLTYKQNILDNKRATPIHKDLKIIKSFYTPINPTTFTNQYLKILPKLNVLILSLISPDKNGYICLRKA